MMYTCCAAPVAVSLRRSGASTTASVAYWLGNPLLNPAVVAFLLLVAPWQWTATWVGVGVVTVVAGAVLVGRGRRPADEELPSPKPYDQPVALGFLRTLARMTLVLIPEYVAVSLPSLVMVHRALRRTATLTTTALTVLAGLAGGLVLWAL
ncbi:hypothetical protein [Streptomyces bauhiniae]|uniref:hypothetical protein n=1 Tax=Streptomyces bauhiniae TaxID=2340725 RepID=UPI00365A7DCE